MNDTGRAVISGECFSTFMLTVTIQQSQKSNSFYEIYIGHRGYSIETNREVKWEWLRQVMC